MSDKELIDWLNWYVQNEDNIEMYEEDGGLILHLSNVGSILGKDARDCLVQAAQAHPVT